MLKVKDKAQAEGHGATEAQSGKLVLFKCVTCGEFFPAKSAKGPYPKYCPKCKEEKNPDWKPTGEIVDTPYGKAAVWVNKKGKQKYVVIAQQE
jgi:NAD-dependent SIR2 family protein deacetylase